jgi:hypothetical protein
MAIALESGQASFPPFSFFSFVGGGDVCQAHFSTFWIMELSVND